MDYLNNFVNKMFQVLNGPIRTVSIYGNSSIIRKITSKEYTFRTPAGIYPVTLDYTQTIVNSSDNSVYNFIRFDKIRGTNELMIIINPHNTKRFICRIYDYQLYITKRQDILLLPAIHSFERFLAKEYQLVQGHIEIENPSDMRPKA